MGVGWLHWYWPVALTIIALVIFAIPETVAIKYGGETFSAFMAKMAQNGPIGRLWTFAWGGLVIGLAIHFLGWCVSCTGG